jgi:hypothetical protein
MKINDRPLNWIFLLLVYEPNWLTGSEVCELFSTQFCSSDKNKISNRKLSLRNEAIPFISLEIMNYLFEQTESF